MDFIAPVSWVGLAPVSIQDSAAAVTNAPDPTSVRRFADALADAPERTQAVQDGSDFAMQNVQQKPQVLDVGHTQEDAALGDSAYQKYFKFFTTSNDPIMNEQGLSKTREILTQNKTINNYQDIAEFHHKMMQASAELSTMNIKSTLIIHTGLESKKAVEKLVQQQG